MSFLSSLLFTPSLVDSIRGIQQLLQTKGIHIPTHARGAYNNLFPDSKDFRLYVWVWPTSILDHAEWMLLVVLGYLNPGDRSETVRLCVHDRHQNLAEQTCSGATAEQYLFAQVLGDRQEQFHVTVDIDHHSITLPPFCFDPDKL